MNPLEKYPNLFANGKFKMRLNIYPESKNRAIGKITCFSFPGACGIGALKVDGLGWVASKKDGRNPKLIARPIEDMTDGEVEDIYNASCESIVELSHDSCEQMREFWEERTKSGNLKFVTARWMLKIGVYAFDQSHFQDKTVIDSREVDHADS